MARRYADGSAPYTVTPPLSSAPCSLRGHDQRRPLQLPVPGDLGLPRPPHPGAPGVRGAARPGPVPLGPGDRRRGPQRRRPREHHVPRQALPVRPGAPLPAGPGGGQVPEAEVTLVPRPGGPVIVGVAKCGEGAGFNG